MRLDPGSITQFAKGQGQNRNTVRTKLRKAGLVGPLDPAIVLPILKANTSAKYKVDPADGETLSYNEWEKRYKAAKARQEEFKLAQIEGTLVKRAAVQKAIFESGRRVRDSLENLPARLSGIFAAESDQARIFALFSAEIQQCLETLTA